MPLQATQKKSASSKLEANTVNVLVIDDNQDDRELYRRLFKRLGLKMQCNMVEATNGDEGLKYLEDMQPDCILLDYSLGTETGIDVLNRIKQQKADNAFAVIMVTGQGDEKVAVEAMKNGVMDYLVKADLTEDALERSVRNVIEKKRLQNIIIQHREELERSNRELADFCHTVSHDLKAPLRKIKSFCGLLRQKAQDKLDRDGQRYVEQLITDSNRINHLVQDLLTYSKTMNTKEPVEEVDLGKLVKEVISDLEILIEENKAKIDVSELPVIDGLKIRLRQLFQNLIANAIKFKSDKKPVVKVSAERLEDFWQINIADNGIGIEEEYLERIFGAFKRIHSQDEYEGSGIGLSICQKVVEMHKGKIWAESTIGEGTTFKFILPAKLDTH